MNHYVYDRVKLVTLQNDDTKYELPHILGIDEYDHEIVIISASQVEGLNRGFVGNLCFHLRGFPITDDTESVTTVIGYKDTLLARIIISSSPNCPIEWKYTFLKD